jgi:imidazolonepropionase-like amidohydrolase
MSGRVRIQCGSLFDGTGTSLRHGVAIDVEGGRILGVGSDLPSTEDMRLVDWRDCTVLPGLVDAHDHLTLDVGDEEAQCRKSAAWMALTASANARRVLAAGVTTVRDCGAKGHVDVSVRAAIREGVIAGPRLLVSGTPLTISGGQCWFLGGEVASAAEIRAAVRAQVDAGVDFIKVFVTGGVATRGSDLLRSQFSGEELAIMVEEAHARARRVVAHCHGGPGAQAAVKAGVDSIEHGIFLTTDDLAAMAAAGVPLVVTVGIFARLATDPSMPPAVQEKCREAAARYVDTIARAREAGVRVAIGTDTVHADLVAEMRSLVQGGFTAAEALVAATAHGAMACWLSDVGTVARGQRADLIACRGNPLTDLSALEHIVHVMTDGHPVA